MFNWPRSFLFPPPRMSGTDEHIVVLLDSAWIESERLPLLLMAQIEYFGRNAFQKVTDLRTFTVYVITASESDLYSNKCLSYTSARDFQRNFRRHFNVTRAYAMRKAIRSISADDKIGIAFSDIDKEINRLTSFPDASAHKTELRLVLLLEPTSTLNQRNRCVPVLESIRKNVHSLYIYTTAECLVLDRHYDVFFETTSQPGEIHLLEMRLLNLVCHPSPKEGEAHDAEQMNDILTSLKKTSLTKE